MASKHPALRFYLFTLLVTLFVGVWFTSSDFLTIPTSTPTDWIILLFQWGVVVIALYFLMALLTINKYVFAVIFPILTFVCSLLAWFRFTINAAFTPMILDATLQNDMRTSAELVSSGLVLFVAVSLVTSILFVMYRFKRIKVAYPVITTIAGFLLLIVMTTGPFKRPISERIPFNIYYTVKKYWEEKHIIRQDRIDLTEGLHCGDEDITVVMVIGESLRPDHLGINGYERNTTPLLSNEDIISFTNIYTEYTYTNRSIPHLLTRADSTHSERAYSEKSFISFFNACGYKTVWLGNQEAADTYVYFMNEADSLVYVNMEKSPYVFDKWVDGDLLPLYDEVLQKGYDKQLIVLHTIGSHWWYNSHFTEELAQYQPVVKSKVVSSNTREEMINSYDNTVLYTDYFLMEVINRLRDKKAILIYQSDHGEALGEEGVWLHASETPYTHQAAGMIWMSPSYKEAFPEAYKNAIGNAPKRYRTDYLFHSILDAAGMESAYIDKSMSVLR